MGDALCAGHLITRVLDDGEDHELNDAALAARALAVRKPSKRFLAATAGGRALREVGLEDDLEICADVDRHGLVAEMLDQAITLGGA
jgi:phosphosulfolactate phosphohydrolase-like enzyme